MSVDVCGSRGAALAARRMGRAVHASIVAFTFSLPQWASLRWPRGREGSSRISSFRNTMLQTAARCHVCLLSEKRDVGLQPLQWAPRTGPKSLNLGTSHPGTLLIPGPWPFCTPWEDFSVQHPSVAAFLIVMEKAPPVPAAMWKVAKINPVAAKPPL